MSKFLTGTTGRIAPTVRDSYEDGREPKTFSPSSLPMELWMKCIWEQAGHITGLWASLACSGHQPASKISEGIETTFESSLATSKASGERQRDDRSLTVTRPPGSLVP